MKRSGDQMEAADALRATLKIRPPPKKRRKFESSVSITDAGFIGAGRVPDGGLLANALISEPQDRDILNYDAGEGLWINAPNNSVSTVHTDGIYIGGDGSVVDPITLLGVDTDGSTILGDGLAADRIRLNPTGVTAGPYTNANITVNATGQITLASDGAPGGVTSIESLAGTIVPTNEGSGLWNVDLAVQGGVTPGTFTYATVGVNSHGVLTACASGITPLLLVTTDASLTGSGTGASPLKVATQAGVTPGTYTYATVTVNADGIITVASSGSSPLIVVTTDSSLTGAGTAASPLKVAAQGGVTPGTYTYATVTVNADGIITATSSGAAPLISPMTTEGDIIYQHSSAPTRLAVGSANTFFTSNGTDPSYQALSISGNFSGNGVGTALDLSTVGIAATNYFGSSLGFDTFGRLSNTHPPVKMPVMGYCSWMQNQSTANGVFTAIAANNLYSGGPPFYAPFQNPSGALATNGQFTCPSTGIYYCSTSHFWPNTLGSFRNCFIEVGSVIAGGAKFNNVEGVCASVTVFVTAGTILSFSCSQDTGSTTIAQCQCSICFLGFG